MTRFLRILRGLPGSGKSTFARLYEDAIVCSADDFFSRDGDYIFDADFLDTAHAACRAKARTAALTGAEIVIDNTNVRRADYAPYLQLAKNHDYTVLIHDLFDGGCDDETLAERNTHHVPLATIRRMRAKYEH